jgi:hypothetical protein
VEDKDVDLWWDVVQDIIHKDIGKVYRMYERNEKLYMHNISQMVIYLKWKRSYHHSKMNL